MSSLDIRILERELDKTRSALSGKQHFINQIKVWLMHEVSHQQTVVDGLTHLSDGTDGICKGRHECAKALLEQIEKWEDE